MIGGRLAEAGHDVALIARGAHYDALRRDGLTVESADRTVTLDDPGGRPSLRRSPSEETTSCVLRHEDPTHRGGGAARSSRSRPLSSWWCRPRTASRTNGILIRRFANVYGICVMCPASHLEPGIVQAYSSPDQRPARHRPMGRTGRRDGHRDLGCAPRLDLRVGPARRHRPLEVRQVAHEPRQRRRGAVRPCRRHRPGDAASRERGDRRARGRRHRRSSTGTRTASAGATS